MGSEKHVRGYFAAAAAASQGRSLGNGTKHTSLLLKMQSYGEKGKVECLIRKSRYERKRQSRLGILRILSEAKSGGSKGAEGNGRRGREKCPAAVTRRALVNNSKNSCTAYSLLKDGCRLTPRCFLWRAFQSGCPCWWLPGADRDSYRDGSVASQAC